MDESQPEVKSSKDRLLRLVNNEFFSDMAVFVGPAKTPVYVNKAILGIASPYFEKLFYGPLATASSHTNLPDTEPEVFKLFLDYIYTDNLDEKLDGDLVWKLIELGKMCLVPHLEEACHQQIFRNFNVNNVLGYLAQSEWNEDWEVRNAAERFIDWSIKEILETREFLNLDLDLLCKLFERDTLEIQESVLHDSLLRWSDAECGRQGIQPTTENRLKVLDRSLELIRVSRMADDEIAASPLDGIFPDSAPKPSKSPKRSVVREFAPKKYHVQRFAGFEDVRVRCYKTHSGSNLESPAAISEDVDLTIGIVSDKQIFLHGVGVFCDFEDIDDRYSSLDCVVCVDLEVQVFDMSKNSSVPYCETGRYTDTPGDFMENYMFSYNGGPLLIRPGIKYDIRLQGKIKMYCTEKNLPEEVLNAEGKKGVSPFSEVTVGPGYNGNHATVKIESPVKIESSANIESPHTWRRMSGATEFSLGNIPELIFSF